MRVDYRDKVSVDSGVPKKGLVGSEPPIGNHKFVSAHDVLFVRSLVVYLLGAMCCDSCYSIWLPKSNRIFSTLHYI